MEQQDKFYKGLFFGAMLGTVGGTLMGLLFAPTREVKHSRSFPEK